MLDRIREFLRENDYNGFKDGDDFAEQLLERMRDALDANWSRPAAVNAIKRTTGQIYKFYRLRDASVFADDQSPVRLKLGGPDTVSINFVERLDHFYFSKFADNTDQSLRKFLTERYLADGAALFGRESSEELDDFRKAAGEKLAKLSDRSIKGIVHTSVARIRNWAHVASLQQASIEYARYVATLDARTTDLCENINGKKFKVATAQSAIERLNQMEPGEFAKELYESSDARAFRKDPVSWLDKESDESGIISEAMTESGLCIPPLHTNCRTRLQGEIPGVKS